MRFINFKKYNYPLIFILLLAVVLRLYKADYQSIWLDEVLTMIDADPDLSLSHFYEGILFWEYIPHLYFLLNRIAFEIFGFSTLVARLLSALIGVLGVYSIYLLGKVIYNKKTGLIAALLLAVNIFHISYSQEIRPYGMLFLFTVLSFYRLVIFIKNPSLKNAVFYGLFTGLILHAHFFGVITIFSQCLLLLYFLIVSKKENKGNFLKKSVVAGIVTFLIFLPAIEAFIHVVEMSSFWFDPPKQDAYTQMFRQFFGKSEIVLSMINFIILYYVITVFKEKLKNYSYEEVTGNRLASGFLILFVWLSVSLLIPLLKSYLDMSMLITRYFISILAILIIITAIGIYLIKNRLIKSVVIISLVCFSLVDLIVVNDYYNKVTKTQLRELTSELKAKNTEKADIVTYWHTVFRHFFKDDALTQIKENTLDGYVAEMQNGIIRPDSFWYADANSRPYKINDKTKAYLEQNFILKERIIYHDTWAHYYEVIDNDTLSVDKSSLEEISIDAYTNSNNDAINYRFENFGYSEKYIKVSGWAYIKESNTKGAAISIVLIGADRVFKVTTDTVRRDDVSDYFSKELPFSGFYAKGNLSSLKSGRYKVGILIKDNNQEKLIITSKFIEK